MNLLVLCEHLWPEGSGGELANYLYVDLLQKSGINVKVVLTTNIFHPAWTNLSIYRLSTCGQGKYTLLTPSSFQKLTELTIWADVVYFTDLFYLIPLIKAFKKPIVAHLHSTFPACSIGASYNLRKNLPCSLNTSIFSCLNCITSYERIGNYSNLRKTLLSTFLNSNIGALYASFLKYADNVVFVSNFQKKLVMKRLNYLVNKSTVIYNPLPNLPYSKIEGDDAGYFGGINALKGFLVLMRAWSKVYCKYESNLHIALADNLNTTQLCKQLKIIPYGKLMGPSYEKVFQNIKVVLVPSVVPEALPYVISEACLRGRLVIASAVGGIPEQSRGLDGVFLVEPNNIKNLADSIEHIFSINKTDANELGLKNRKYLLKKFNTVDSVKKLIKIFEKF